MVNKLNRKCCVCGKEYSYCNTCGEDRNKPLWMLSYCSENCKNIYYACASYNMKNATKDKAKEILNKCNLDNRENFTESAKKIIEELYKEENIINSKNIKKKKNIKKNKKR